MSTEEHCRIDGTGRVVQAQAPASGISVPRHLGVGADLVHSLDYVVMLQIMFNVASKIECTPISVWEQLKARGIRSAKDANELVGKNAVYDSFARLLTAGYLRRTRLPHPTKPGRMGPVVYEAFDNPAWNPDHRPAPAPEDHDKAKPQVGTLPGTPDMESREEGKTAGRTTSRNAGRGNAGRGNAEHGKRAKTAGQNTSRVPGRGMAAPPHPPEGEDSSSPYPLTAPGGVLPSQREEEGFTQEETAAAARFLQQMKRWQAGAATARKCAPRLVRAMRAQGWPALAELDEEHLGLLEAEILKNTGGAVSWSRCLPGWVDDLRLYERVKPRPRREQQQTADVCRKPGHGGGAFLADDCGECRAEAGRVAREGASRVDTAALIGLLHSKRRGPTP